MKPVEDDAAIKTLVKELMKHDEICFDTETTGIDANDAELVGLSFSIKAWRSILCSMSGRSNTRQKKFLLSLRPLFNDESKIWIGQNIKYDMLRIEMVWHMN